jgi:uncharacterized membrane protein
MAPTARALIVLVFLLAVPLPAYAYLDPQTGSMIVSAIVAFVATIGMGVQAYWHKLVSLLRRSPKREARRGSEEDESLEG